MVNELIGDLEFENELTRLGEDQPELIKFLARQQYKTNTMVVKQEDRICALEKRSNRMFITVGSIGTFIGGLIVGIADFMIRRG